MKLYIVVAERLDEKWSVKGFIDKEKAFALTKELLEAVEKLSELDPRGYHITYSVKEMELE